MRTKGAMLVIALLMTPLARTALAAAAEASREVTIQATIPRNGDFMAFGFDSLWMMSGSDLVRINPGDNSVTDIPVKGARGRYRGVAVGEGAIWVPATGSDTIYKIDPQTNQVVMQIAADLINSEGSIGTGNGKIWAMTGHGMDQVLTRYDAETGAEEAKIRLPSAGSGIIFDFGSVWITGTNKGELYRVEPVTNQITNTIVLHSQPRFLTSGEGSVWVLNQGDGTVQRIDGTSGKLLATIETGASGAGGDIAIGGGSVWVTSMLVPVIQIDPATNSVKGRFKRPVGVYLGDAIRYGAGSLWVSGSSVFRIKPPE